MDLEQFESAFLNLGINEGTDVGVDSKTNVALLQNENTIETLENDLNKFESRMVMLMNLSKVIEDMSMHPRVEARCKLSKFVDVECLLTTSEYIVKYADYSVISSLKATSAYIQNSIDGAKEMIEYYKDNIEKLNDQQLLAQKSYGRKVNVVDTDKGSVTFYDNGLVDIIENEAESYKKPTRIPRFKSNAERDNHLKEQIPNKEQK